LTVVGGGRQIYEHHKVTTQLQEALAELDCTDPGWRLKDIEAARAPVSDAENGALCVVAAAKHLPKDWPSQEFDDAFKGLEPPELLSPDQFALLRTGLMEVDPALQEARKLAGRSAGRHRITYLRNIFGILLPGQGEVWRISRLLEYEAMRQSQVGDMKGALTSCRAALNAARSIGDEPAIVSQLIRIARVVAACQAIERTLAQGEPGPDDPERMQQALEEEEELFPGLLIMTRGERALTHEMFDALESGDVRLSQLAGDDRTPPTWQEKYLGWIMRDNFRAEHPPFLSLMNRWIEVAQLPSEEQAAAERQLAADVDNTPREAILTRILLPAFRNINEAFRRKQANIRCTTAALAAERYRRKHGAWPESLAKLATAKLLAAVPLDPYEGEPLRYQRLPDGIAIYSMGPDGEDDEGALDRENVIRPGASFSIRPGTDVGFRLWDVKHRRQPPRPEPPAEPE
jgi:hypothetical protein